MRGLTAIVVTTALLSVACSGFGDGAGNFEESVVRVRSRTGAGTGFTVETPYDFPVFATNYHVIARGGDLSIEQHISRDSENRYQRVYEGIVILAVSPEHDLALVGLPHVPKAEFAPLPIGTPERDAEIRSYGFPASSLTDDAGLVMKEGRVTSMVNFDYGDVLSRKVHQQGITKGLLVSTDIEPGFSGGPTVDASGRVVGVNVLKDLKHAGQNGVIDARELTPLLEALPPDPFAAPTPEEAHAFLQRVRDSFLTVPASEVSNLDNATYLSVAQRPRVADLMQQLLSDFEDRTIDKSEGLSAAASTGIKLARVPGAELTTLYSDEVRTSAKQCGAMRRAIGRFLGGAAASGPDCLGLEARAFARDLASGVLQAGLAYTELRVLSVQVASPEKRLYRAQVQPDGSSKSFQVFLVREAGGLRLSLFDENDKLYAHETNQPYDVDAYVGTWTHQRKVTGKTGDEYTYDETLEVVKSGSADLVASHTYLQSGLTKPGFSYPCSRSRTYEAVVKQRFSGPVSQGTALMKADFKATREGACRAEYTDDVRVLLERRGAGLAMYRTSGDTAPEEVLFERAP